MPTDSAGTHSSYTQCLVPAQDPSNICVSFSRPRFECVHSQWNHSTVWLHQWWGSLVMPILLNDYVNKNGRCLKGKMKVGTFLCRYVCYSNLPYRSIFDNRVSVYHLVWRLNLNWVSYFYLLSGIFGISFIFALSNLSLSHTNMWLLSHRLCSVKTNTLICAHAHTQKSINIQKT